MSKMNILSANDEFIMLRLLYVISLALFYRDMFISVTNSLENGSSMSIHLDRHQRTRIHLVEHYLRHVLGI